MIGKLDQEVIEKFKEFQEKTGKHRELYIEDVEFYQSDIFNDTDNIKLIGSKKIGTHDELKEINDKDGIPVYDASANILTFVKKDRFPDEVFTTEDNRNPDISFASEGNSSAGTNFITHKDSYFINNHRTVMKFSKKYYSKYIYYNIFKMKEKYGFKRGYIPSQTELKKLHILVPIPKDLNKFYPSYKIQEAIVEFLEYSFDMIEQIRKNVDRKYELYERLNKALIPSVFIKDYVKVAFGRYAKKHGIGFDITDVEFAIKRIHSDNPEEVVCKKRMGFTPKTSANGDINWFRVEDLNTIKGLYIEKPNTIKKTTIDNVIAKNGKTSSKNTPIQKGDILVSFLATPGIVKIYDSNDVSYCNQAIDILTPNKNIDKRYLAYNCMLEYPKYGKKQTMGTNLDNSEKMKIKIFIPKDLENYNSVEIQKIIADFIEYTENRIQKEFDKMDKVYDALNRLHKTYLARTFSLIQWGVKQ